MGFLAPPMDEVIAGLEKRVESASDNPALERQLRRQLEDARHARTRAERAEARNALAQAERDEQRRAPTAVAQWQAQIDRNRAERNEAISAAAQERHEARVELNGRLKRLRRERENALARASVDLYAAISAGDLEGALAAHTRRRGLVQLGPAIDAYEKGLDHGRPTPANMWGAARI